MIYVGKAKDLHKRVAQYFVPPERLNVKTRLLVSKIADAQFSVVDTGGYTSNSEDVFEKAIRRQVEIAIEEADAVLFMVEAGTGITDPAAVRQILATFPTE